MVFALYGCNKSVSIAEPKAYTKDFLDRISDKGKSTCGAFVEKKFAGKTYEVAEASVSGKNGIGAEIQYVMGIVEDKSADLHYSLRLDDFNRFLATGDTSVFSNAADFTVKSPMPTASYLQNSSPPDLPNSGHPEASQSRANLVASINAENVASGATGPVVSSATLNAFTGDITITYIKGVGSPGISPVYTPLELAQQMVDYPSPAPAI